MDVLYRKLTGGKTKLFPSLDTVDVHVEAAISLGSVDCLLCLNRASHAEIWLLRCYHVSGVK